MKKLLKFEQVLVVLTILFASCNNTNNAVEQKQKYPLSFCFVNENNKADSANRSIEYFTEETDGTKITPVNLVVKTYNADTEEFEYDYRNAMAITKITFNNDDENLLTFVNDAGVNKETYSFHSMESLETTEDPLCAYEKLYKYIYYGIDGTGEYLLFDEGFYSFNMKMYDDDDELIAVCYNSTFISLYTAQTYYYEKFNRNAWWLEFVTEAPDVGKGDMSVTIKWDTSNIVKVTAGICKYTNANRYAIGYEAKELTPVVNGTQASAVYAFNDMKVGNYWLRIEAEAPNATENKIYVKLLSIESGRMTEGEYSLDNEPDKYYTITWNLDDGEWAAGYTPITKRNVNAGFPLPNRLEVVKDEYELAGWYESSSFEGEPVITIPSGTAENKIFYAKWVPKKYYHAGDLVAADGSITQNPAEAVSVIYKEADFDTPALGIYVKEQVNNTAFAKSVKYFYAKSYDESFIQEQNLYTPPEGEAGHNWYYFDSEEGYNSYIKLMTDNPFATKVEQRLILEEHVKFFKYGTRYYNFVDDCASFYYTRGAYSYIKNTNVYLVKDFDEHGNIRIIFKGDPYGYDNYESVIQWLVNKNSDYYYYNTQLQYREILPEYAPGAYPAFEWINSIEEEGKWYIPAIEELYNMNKYIDENDAIREALDSVGFTLHDLYMSSSQYSYEGFAEDEFNYTWSYKSYPYENDSEGIRVGPDKLFEDSSNNSSYKTIYYPYSSSSYPGREKIWFMNFNRNTPEEYKKHEVSEQRYVLAVRQYDERAETGRRTSASGVYELSSGTDFDVLGTETYTFNSDTKTYTAYDLTLSASTSYTDYKFYINDILMGENNAFGNVLTVHYNEEEEDQFNDDISFLNSPDIAPVIFVTARNSDGLLCSATYTHRRVN